ncbi:MAG: DUF664 domain-containing protein [Armatimonadetes bacterium]|nr:DUF664 domain-containing protein [Armatimonadota bacterium]
MTGGYDSSVTDFAKSWNLSRGRLKAEIEGFSHAQMSYRIQPGALSVGEMVVHVAGVEIWFNSQLTGRELSPEEQRVANSATEGVVNDNPFPFSDEEITPELVAWALDTAESHLRSNIENPSPEFLAKEIKSALGPIITGEGALARFAFHPGYHQGQVYLYKTSPDFPA